LKGIGFLVVGFLVVLGFFVVLCLLLLLLLRLLLLLLLALLLRLLLLPLLLRLLVCPMNPISLLLVSGHQNFPTDWSKNLTSRPRTVATLPTL